MQPLITEFLTPEECLEVDRALLSSKEKFSARLAIYGLRALKQISQQVGSSVAGVTEEQVRDWIKQDETIKQQIEVDASFESFFTRLVLSSLRPLHQIATAEGIAIEAVTVQQVVAWFEQEAKANLPKG